MEIRVRLMEERDVDVADRIVRLAFGTFLGAPDPLAAFGDSDMAHTRYRAAPDGAFVADADGRVIGSNFLARWGSFGFFGPLTVEPQFWDQGVAQRLLRPTVQLFETWRCSNIGLFTFGHSAKHVSLYQKFGFWARFLTPIMSKRVTQAQPASGYVRFSTLAPADQSAALSACRETTDRLYDGLDLTREIQAVAAQKLGDTVVRFEDSKVCAFAVCHLGAGSEAGTGTCYVKFGCARPGAQAGERFDGLLGACEALAHAGDATRLVAGVNVSRHEAYRTMLGKGFRIDMQGVAMHRDNEPGFCKPGVFVIDDWR